MSIGTVIRANWKKIAKVLGGAFSGATLAKIDAISSKILAIHSDLHARGVLFAGLMAGIATFVILAFYPARERPLTVDERKIGRRRVVRRLLIEIVLLLLAALINAGVNRLAAGPSLEGFFQEFIFEWGIPVTYGLFYGLLIALVAELVAGFVEYWME